MGQGHQQLPKKPLAEVSRSSDYQMKMGQGHQQLPKKPLAEVSRSSDFARTADVQHCPHGANLEKSSKKVRWKRRRLAKEKEAKEKGKPDREAAKLSLGDVGGMEASSSAWNIPGERGWMKGPSAAVNSSWAHPP
jgi:hypothetical protein